MKLFYSIWVDVIIRAKSQPANKHNWRGMTLAYMTTIMAVDFLFLMIVLQEAILGHYFYQFEIPGLSYEVGSTISFVVLFAGPPLVINYVLIFRNRRYEKLIKKYRYHDGKLAVAYMVLGLSIPMIALLFGMFYGLI